MTGTNQAEDNQSATMTIAKRIQPGALTVDKGRNTARPIPAFLTKLYTMVNDSSTDHLIKWNKPNGDSFFVVSSERFGRELLPKYFKHSNFGSFVRQLNMYGFHKVPHLNQGVLQGEIPETEMLEFTNINFQRAQPDLLCLIQHKKSCPESTHPATNEQNEPSSTAVPPNTNTTPPNTADLQTILMDIMSIKKHQTLISSDLKTLQSSNAHLWKEAIANRDRIKRCQDTINKILGFLAQVFAGKVSSLEDPPLGNSGQSSSNRTGVNLKRTTTDEHHIGILMREGGSSSSNSSSSIPDLDRHRPRTKNSRDQHHHSPTKNFSYEKSPSNTALSLYSQIRHPRLMLEDTERTSSSDPNSDPSTNNPSNLGPTLDHSSSLQNLSTNRNHTLERLSSPTPSSLHTSSSTSSPKHGQSSTQFQDSSIDPNLETSTEINGANTQSNQNPIDGSTTDDQQSSPDAVFQALFNNNNSSSSAGFNMNDSSMNGINWADLISLNGLNGFTEDMIESNPSNITSPLRITDGHINTTTPPLPSSSGALPSMDMNTDSCLQLINNTQNQANQILNLNNKVDNLENTIENLYLNLPDQMIDYLNPTELDKSNLLANNNMNNGNLNLSFLGSHLSDNNNNNQIDNIDQNDFDTDAFLRTLISSEDKTQSTSNSRLLSFREQEGEAEDSAEDNILKEMITSSSTGPNSTTLTTTRGIDQFRSPGKAKEIARINESNNGGDTMDRLDIEKFLDEWTPHEDHSRILSGLTPMIMSPVSTPTTDLTQNLPRVSNQPPPPTSSSSSTTLRSSNLLNSSSSGPTLNKSLKNRVAFDFNDDDHLRRIMSSKKNTSSTSIPSIPIPNHNNHNLDRSASSVHSRKRLLDDSVPISDQTSTAHLFNLLNSSENHHHNPTFNSLTTNPSSSNSNLIHNKKTRL
ncbi:hypothetical protein Pst134EA_017285 [Puccinia striiformis f. sp. tritici]|uniref:hypothetical protein n=1 Tax=Puccinia striiformis f. sp. tritici TaxID=168172 RepID=UPI002007F08A|nr:hypothetical protein Pst134EA_017285 [Puccinia striiformis f. sp. tritici]KAH9460977.1 hypothetical protein Pst134EA_017285 [Puccinia striiformis f. sp. tritici]